jgi:hypothetical protein
LSQQLFDPRANLRPFGLERLDFLAQSVRQRQRFASSIPRGIALVEGGLPIAHGLVAFRAQFPHHLRGAADAIFETSQRIPALLSSAGGQAAGSSAALD